LCRTDSRAVDYGAIESTEREAKILGAVDEKRIVNFVDVVFVVNEAVEPAKAIGDLLRQLSPLDIEVPRGEDAADYQALGKQHQSDFPAR